MFVSVLESDEPSLPFLHSALTLGSLSHPGEPGSVARKVPARTQIVFCPAGAWDPPAVVEAAGVTSAADQAGWGGVTVAQLGGCKGRVVCVLDWPLLLGRSLVTAGTVCRRGSEWRVSDRPTSLAGSPPVMSR
jgi:hypothetical protein